MTGKDYLVTVHFQVDEQLIVSAESKAKAESVVRKGIHFGYDAEITENESLCGVEKLTVTAKRYKEAKE